MKINYHWKEQNETEGNKTESKPNKTWTQGKIKKETAPKDSKYPSLAHILQMIEWMCQSKSPLKALTTSDVPKHKKTLDRLRSLTTFNANRADLNQPRFNLFSGMVRGPSTVPATTREPPIWTWWNQKLTGPRRRHCRLHHLNEGQLLPNHISHPMYIKGGNWGV